MGFTNTFCPNWPLTTFNILIWFKIKMTSTPDVYMQKCTTKASFYFHFTIFNNCNELILPGHWFKWAFFKIKNIRVLKQGFYCTLQRQRSPWCSAIRVRVGLWVVVVVLVGGFWLSVKGSSMLSIVQECRGGLLLHHRAWRKRGRGEWGDGYLFYFRQSHPPSTPPLPIYLEGKLVLLIYRLFWACVGVRMLVKSNSAALALLKCWYAALKRKLLLFLKYLWSYYRKITIRETMFYVVLVYQRLPPEFGSRKYRKSRIFFLTLIQ